MHRGRSTTREDTRALRNLGIIASTVEEAGMLRLRSVVLRTMLLRSVMTAAWSCWRS
jgi:hypothetical protein